MSEFMKQVGTGVAIILVGIVAVCLIVARSLVPSMAITFVSGLTTWMQVTFFVLTALSIVAIPTLLAVGVYFLLKPRYTESGQFGGYVHSALGKWTPLRPLAIDSPHERTVKEVIPVPTVAALLQDGSLGTDALLLGYKADGKPHWGSWNDIRTFAIAGKGRSGKTVTMFFFIVQAILNGCVVWVADPHAGGKSSITNLLQPLAQWIRFAKTDTEIAEMTDDFIDVMEQRVAEELVDAAPMLLVTDEFTRMVENNVKVYDTVVACAQQYAKYNGYAMIAGHEWTGKEIVKLRRALHAIFVHRLDAGYTKYLINDSKYAKRSESLKTGCNFFKDTDGDIHELKTPLGTVNDAVTVATMLQQIEAPEYLKQIVSPSETNRFNCAETRNVSEVLSLEAPKETKRFTKHDTVRALKAQGFNQSTIIQNIWNCKPGGTQEYKAALAEYKQILQEIAQEVH